MDTSTRFNLFSETYKGLPYSYTYNGSDKVWGDSNSNRSRQLMYIPEVNDPNVVYDMTADEINEFNEWISAQGLSAVKSLAVTAKTLIGSLKLTSR